MSRVSEPWTSECKPADCWPRLFFCLLCALQQLRSLQLAVAHAHLRGRDAFHKIVVVGCMSHACVGKTEKVRVVEVSDSQQRIDFFSFFSSRTRRDFLKGLGWGEGFFFSFFPINLLDSNLLYLCFFFLFRIVSGPSCQWLGTGTR